MSSDAVVSAAITGALFLGGQWVVARTSKRANDKTAEVQRDANAIDGFDKLAGRLEADMERLRGEVSTLRDELDKTNRHVRKLEGERVRDRAMIRHLITYARTLRDALHAARLPVPEPPGGLDLDSGSTA